ncbi:MAG: ATP-binding protein [Desulfovibrionaceae bacterium]
MSGTPETPHPFDQIYNVDRLTDLFQRFFDLTGLGCGILDAEGALRAYSGERSLCRDFLFREPTAEGVCLLLHPIRDTDTATGMHLRHCRGGLQHALYPVRYGDHLLAVVFLGQFLTAPPDPATARERAQRLGHDPAAYLEALSRVPVMDPERLKRTMDFFQTLVDQLTILGVARLEALLHEQRIQVERQRFRSIFEGSADPIAILDTNRNFVDVNPALVLQFGQPRDRLLGQNARSIHISPSHAETFAAMAYPAVAEHGHWRGQWPLRDRQGRVRDVELAISALPPGERGTEYVVLLRDMTEYNATRHTLEATLEEMRTIFDNQLIGVSFTRDGVIERINARGAEILGGSPTELVGRHSREMDPDPASDGPPPSNRFLYGVDEQGRLTDETLLRRIDGQEVWIRASGKLLDLGDTDHGVIWVFDDITDRRRMEQERQRAADRAEAANQAKSAFLATMSHEIRNPLSGMLAMIQLALEGLPDNEARDCLTAAMASGRSLLGVLGEVLDLSKVEAGRLELNEEDFAPRELVRSVLASFTAQAREKGLALHDQVAPAVPDRLRGDPGRLRQMLANLVGNALKFTERGGVDLSMTRLSGRPDEVRLLVCVQDTGVGIPEADQPKVFERFGQADGPRRQLGTGLGLDITRRLVNLMGGEITLHSEPGEGTLVCFSIRLAPAATPAAGPAPAEGDSAPAPTARVLVAEDNRVNQIAVRRFLERRGHQVVCVEDGQQAVDRVQQERFDVVLMDIQMPVLDGEEATRRIRDLPPPAGTVPIVALTAHAMKGDRDRFLALGMDDYLDKPVDLARLNVLVSAYAARAREDAHG